MKKFDLIVIGSGSGLDVANGAAASGWSVCLVENGPLGGTCLNRGCIPSKILVHSADVAMAIRRASEFGLRVADMEVDFASFPAIQQTIPGQGTQCTCCCIGLDWHVGSGTCSWIGLDWLALATGHLIPNQGTCRWIGTCKKHD